ncbi:hypothetical protein DICSQDRAFT_173796 [Dichomitus squalens LYAD-421 SS1]|uniref:Uncharacterized protein n=1 Tax=Dichomitus squalens (strain LYAD-421) TaxID=732165 RepID=R7SRH4_DICSQ|nr:uncharacterized protein DICSQDRAFT_173796 [Dichomitus squalens LYAD-421 SS1]EJF57572.1 hypothetical protein DICSQDRAFT_173796 [Dichomitus squalens LYAD-421 SS1]
MPSGASRSPGDEVRGTSLPSDSGVAPITRINLSPPSDSVTMVELRELYHQLQLDYTAAISQIERLEAENEVLRSNQSRRGAPAATPQLAKLKKDIVNAGHAYALLVSPWLDPGVLGYNSSPDVDPLNFEWRWPSGPHGKRLAKERQEEAAAAELFKLLNKYPDVKRNFGDPWGWEQFSDAVQAQKNTATCTVKKNRATIFGSVDSLLGINWSAKVDTFKDNSDLIYYRGEATGFSTLWPPAIFPQHRAGEARVRFRTVSTALTIRSMLYGLGAVQDGHQPKGNTTGVHLGIKALTPNLIAFAALLVRHSLGYDREFKVTGQSSGANNREDFEYWCKWLTKNWRTAAVEKTVRWLSAQVFGSFAATNAAEHVNVDSDRGIDSDSADDHLDDPDSDDEARLLAIAARPRPRATPASFPEFVRSVHESEPIDIPFDPSRAASTRSSSHRATSHGPVSSPHAPLPSTGSLSVVTHVEGSDSGADPCIGSEPPVEDAPEPPTGSRAPEPARPRTRARATRKNKP